MPLTRTAFIRVLKIGFAILVMFIIAAYALWRSFAYARGPNIIILGPANYASINSTTTNITGRIERANMITLNGKAITIDEQGNFNETIIVFVGTNILTLEARDQFDRTAWKQIQIVRP
ncbi:MAG: hypothetical protein A2830_00120 [Candidatus Taylorbacteria bacterium RIFCSPHIGHO2_01_FULL_44_110]|uniref:Uncharacterized protein n=1 Tax=Candidatus Taylorbacteria bacterium RIFCSPHIGHO2_12_FULL_45_16 TaxID=1802315 RepID=A0A1G2MY87_9BACT|nr:MAG: hypothetical protein A2830_00120 [Candidatus Taylorbacteria bacterium RIFCSPHIGHO2_01_FULL_44_110]OHA28798.1 MAG: hypothetical protein A3F51_02345 [Candidatus Taylorbacteria bacterium RIFCSPHIGHO2_12_FULL_45_16]OHA32857.1 MAG: hypothetical protein A3A23_03145 [Candidatus Taylorbacteria bacterium RIFCSPLOWO2_01_FULL_45_59]OHA38647.1 MAG: hypothetical protein A3I98_01280 [Candidatus Taylorbacteria bacterium RIFCSPLOWO2_02_FULL_45_10b]OHA43906.1 MAG: hypothetical protein A3G04_01955 [Candi